MSQTTHSLTDDELAAWLRLMYTRGVGDIIAQTLLKHFGLPQNILNTSYSSLTRATSSAVAQALLAPADDDFKELLERTLVWREQDNNHVISLSCPDYPSALLNTAAPPTLLYAKGRLDLLQSEANLAIVGSRNATAQGISNAETFAKELTQGGLSIVSGLALGIDAAAHRGALSAKHAKASTIAVIGTGCDIIYPARNRDLAHQLAQNGLILSEFALGTKALANHFPRRNRIISGLSKGVLVIEAALQSGSLITARQAAEQNREVFAIPGSIHSPLARGCHALIRQGAKLVESAQDILEELHLPTLSEAGVVASDRATEAALDVSVEAQKVLDALGFDPCNLDDLAARTEMSIAQLSSELMILELAGHVEKQAGNIYSRHI